MSNIFVLELESKISHAEYLRNKARRVHCVLFRKLVMVHRSRRPQISGVQTCSGNWPSLGLSLGLGPAMGIPADLPVADDETAGLASVAQTGCTLSCNLNRTASRQRTKQMTTRLHQQAGFALEAPKSITAVLLTNALHQKHSLVLSL